MTLPAPRRRTRIWVIALVVLVAAGSLAPAAADDLRELKEKQAQVRRERAAKASQVNAAEDEFDVVADALAVLDENVRNQEAEVRSAEQALAAAEARLNATRDRISAAATQRDVVQQRLGDIAVERVIGRGESTMNRLDALLGSADPLEAGKKLTLLDVSTGNERDLLDQLRALDEDLELLKADQLDARAEADRLRLERESRLGDLEQARTLQADFVEQAELRLERRLGEAASLADLESDIAGRIQAEEQRIAEELARQRALAEAAARARGASGGGGGGGGSRLPTTDLGNTVVAGGFRVHPSIAANVEAMVAAASAAGLTLGGGGWRSNESQVALRRAHCGSSDYAIYEMPSSSCRPPTARPGASMHERGLALDLTCNGTLIGSRSNPCYQWLAANAAGYGLYNLPSEPWHWSVNGN